MTPTTRALIAAARAGLDPDPAAAARVRAKLNLALGGAAPVAAAPGAAAPGVAAPVAAGGLAVKLAAVIAVASAVATVAVVAVPSQRSRATAVPTPVVDDTALVEAPSARVVAAAPELAVPAPAHRARPVIAVAEMPGSPPSTGEVKLSREVELIDRAMAAMRAGHADAALAAIVIYHRETADRGQLTEDATAIDIEASCMLHLDVTAKLAAFDHTWPSSAERSGLTTACGK